MSAFFDMIQISDKLLRMIAIKAQYLKKRIQKLIDIQINICYDIINKLSVC